MGHSVSIDMRRRMVRGVEGRKLANLVKKMLSFGV